MSATVRRRAPRAVAACVLFCLGAGACNPPERPPVEDSLASLPATPNPALSRFNVPLDYDFTPVLELVERVVPTQFGSMDSVRQAGDDTRRHYAFEARRDPFVAFADGSLMHLRAFLSYRVRGFYKPIVGPTVSAGCGSEDDQPRLVVELVTPLTLTEDWHLASRARVLKLEPASDAEEDRCKVSVLRKDITEPVIEAARKALTDRLPNIDRKIAGVNLENRFKGWWATLSRPIRLTDGVWLTLGPERLRMGRMSGKGHVVTVQAGLDARARVVTSSDPPPVDTNPLPPLAHDTVPDGFHIMLDAVVDYATASQAMTKALRGKAVAEHGKSIAVDSVIVSPAPGGRLALAVAFSGDAQGSLRFAGVPRFEARHRHVVVPDLDYDLETNNQLIKTYAWLRSDALRAYFRSKAVLPEAPVLDRARTLLLQGLNRTIGPLTLSATVDSVAVHAIYVTRSALVARAVATGQAGVAVKQE